MAFGLALLFIVVLKGSRRFNEFKMFAPFQQSSGVAALSFTDLRMYSKDYRQAQRHAAMRSI